MEKMLDMYERLNNEQRATVFTEEERKCLDSLLFYRKLFTDEAFYKAAEKAVGKQIYNDLRK